MMASVRPVRLAEVNWDDTFFAGPGAMDAPGPSLENSLKSFGVLSPPVLWARDRAPYSIVDGFKRLGWLRGREIPEVECFVYPSETRREELILTRIEGRLFGPPINGAEKAWIVSRLSEAAPEEIVLSRYLPALDIAGRRNAFDRWLRLASAGAGLLAALASGAIHERAALELAEWGEDAGTAALSILMDLKCSASIQVEIIERIAEIAVRDGRTREQVLRQPEMEGILHDSRMHHRQKTQAIRDFLERQRLPRLKAKEAEFVKRLEALSLPKAVRLLPPPAFEGERWRLEIDFSRPRELLEILQEMESFAVSTKLDVLMGGSPDGDAPGNPHSPSPGVRADG